jgi:hypothetical protein
VSGNRVAVVPPNGHVADGGGIASDGALTVADSVISDNSAEASSAVPSSIPFDIRQEACCGGLVSETPATIVRSIVRGNSVHSSNTTGDASAVSGGIDADAGLLLVGSTVDRNRVTAEVPAFSGLVAGAAFGGVQVMGAATIRSSVIVGNTLTALGVGSGANAVGAGIANLSGQLTLEKSVVAGNQGKATGNGGLALAGGILNIDFGEGPPVLALTDSVVTANRIEGTGPGYEPQGGGIFSMDLFGPAAFPVTLTRSVVAGNKPDQCFGC